MQIENNKVVQIHYTLKNSSGNVLDTSRDQKPLSYLHGFNNIIPGLEKELTGLNKGDKKDVVVTPEEGYGEYDEKAVVVLDKSVFGPDSQLEPGMQFQAEIEGIPGARIYTILGMEGDSFTADGNHPLAGEELHFSVEVMSIRNADEDEIKVGFPSDNQT